MAASTTAEILTRVNTNGTITWSTSATPITLPNASQRSFHTSTTLSTGDVLLIGGKGSDPASSDLRTIDRFTNGTPPTFNVENVLNYARSMHKSIKLANDSVLIIGNYFKDTGKADTKAELWSPHTP
jgi:hypothetical protein